MGSDSISSWAVPAAVALAVAAGGFVVNKFDSDIDLMRVELDETRQRSLNNSKELTTLITRYNDYTQSQKEQRDRDRETIDGLIGHAEIHHHNPGPESGIPFNAPNSWAMDNVQNAPK